MTHVISALSGCQTKLAHIRPYQALETTLKTLFPLVLFATMAQALKLGVFESNGFFASIYHLPTSSLGFHIIHDTLAAIDYCVIDLMGLYITVLFAYQLAQRLKEPAALLSISAVCSYLLLDFNYVLAGTQQAKPQQLLLLDGLSLKNLGFSCLLVLVVVYSYHGLATWLARRFEAKNTPPRPHGPGLLVAGQLFVFALIGLASSFLPIQTLSGLWANFFSLTLSNPPAQLPSLLLSALWTSCASFFGVSNVLSFIHQTTNNLVGVANLNHALSHKTLTNLPYPLSWHTLYETYAALGGAGMLLAFILVLLFLHPKRDLRRPAQLSLLPCLLNFSSPMMFGLPIFFSPLLILPYLLAPVVNMLLAAALITIKWLPVSVYTVPQTTPSWLLGFLGTNGSYRALLFSLIALAVSMLIYWPFVKALVTQKEAQDENKA